MKTIAFPQWDRCELTVTGIRPVAQHFSDGSVFPVNCRVDSALCYLSGCALDFFDPSGNLLLSAERGSLVYLPQDAFYIAIFRDILPDAALSDQLINFTLRTPEGEPVRFAQAPQIIAEAMPEELIPLFSQMLDEEHRIYRSELRLHRLLYDILDGLFCRSEAVASSIVRPALDYITAHPDFSLLDVESLAKLCNIHPATFRRHFQALFQMSPREYIDAYFIRLADYYLTQRHNSVSETAKLLGFCDVSYFCRFYRKYTGASPGSRRIGGRTAEDGYPSAERD